MNPSADEPLVPCPHCGQHHAAADTACPHCGGELPQEPPPPSARKRQRPELGRVMYGPPPQADDEPRAMYGPAPQPQNQVRAMYGPAPYRGPLPTSPTVIVVAVLAGVATFIGVFWWCWKLVSD